MPIVKSIATVNVHVPTAKIDIPAETTYTGLQIETLTFTVTLKVCASTQHSESDVAVSQNRGSIFTLSVLKI